MWVDVTVPTDDKISARRPDLINYVKFTRTIWILDVVCAWEPIVCEIEVEKTDKYWLLAADMDRRKTGWKVRVGALVIGTLGAVSSLMGQLAQWSKCECQRIISDVQFKALTAAMRIIRQKHLKI